MLKLTEVFFGLNVLRPFFCINYGIETFVNFYSSTTIMFTNLRGKHYSQFHRIQSE